jgi:hypothetical protein
MPTVPSDAAGHAHAIVWIDHREAHVVRFNADAADEKTVLAAHAAHHLHSKAGSASGTHAHGDPAFFRDVAVALKGVREFILGGPASAKAEFVKHLHREAPALVEALVAIKTMERVSDGELLAEGRRLIKAVDRMRPQLG